jgi:hypothetical protein
MRRIDQLVGRDAGKVAHASPVSGQQWGGDVKSARMECAREIAQRLRRVAAAVQQQYCRCIGPLEHKSLAPDNDTVGAKDTPRHREARQVAEVFCSPRSRRDDDGCYNRE